MKGSSPFPLFPDKKHCTTKDIGCRTIVECAEKNVFDCKHVVFFEKKFLCTNPVYLDKGRSGKETD